jgi:hypothetical protein
MTDRHDAPIAARDTDTATVESRGQHAHGCDAHPDNHGSRPCLAGKREIVMNTRSGGIGVIGVIVIVVVILFLVGVIKI